MSGQMFWCVAASFPFSCDISAEVAVPTMGRTNRGSYQRGSSALIEVQTENHELETQSEEKKCFFLCPIRRLVQVKINFPITCAIDAGRWGGYRGSGTGVRYGGLTFSKP